MYRTGILSALMSKNIRQKMCKFMSGYATKQEQWHFRGHDIMNTK